MTSISCGRRGALAAAALALAFALSTVLSLSSPALAAGGVQGNLTGTVQDASTGKPLVDVHVAAQSQSGSFSGTTDAGGHFTLLGLPADTYTVSFTKSGYDSLSQPGVAVFGDETDSVGVLRMNSSLRTIVHVNARARNGAFQPSQTQDVTTISGQRITQALGNPTSQNEQNLILAAPGAMVDSQGNITVRGSLNVELGYQYDGVNFTIPFFDGNGAGGADGTGGYLNNLAGGSGGSLQVVSGSGDATQGNIGAGVINIVPPRGTYPASGVLSAEVTEPYYGHQLDLSYAWATPNNRFSDYLSYDGSRDVPQYAPFGVDASTIGQYYGISRIDHDDLQNNFVFRFGHNNNMSLQWLLRVANEDQYGNYGGLAQASYYPYNPIVQAAWSPEFPGVIDQNGNVIQTPAQEYAATVGLVPDTPSSNVPLTQAQQQFTTPLTFNKLGYTWNLNPTTFLNISWANFYNQTIDQNTANGSFQQSQQELGGQRIFGEMDLTHQFGQNHTTTLAIRAQDDLPRWNLQAPWFSSDTLGFIAPGLANPSTGANFLPDISDWYLPPNTNASVSASNPCPTNPINGLPGSCYLYSYMLAHGLWNGIGSLPRIPIQGIDYHHAIFHETGIGLRDQWTVNSRLHVDYGVRLDADNLDFGQNAYNTTSQALSNPSDVDPNTKLGNDFLRPRLWQPRFAASYQVSAGDALRFSYGRSVNFFFAQTAGTPFDLSNVPSFFFQMPAKDSIANPGCGSGWNPTQPGQPAYNGPGNLYKCPNYADSLYWMGDQNFDAPDLGGQGPPTYNNWDMQWSHQFTTGPVAGFGMKLTGFYRRGYNVEENTLLSNAPPNPVTGQTSAAVFATEANGVEKTSGLEFMLTSPDRPTGFSGFLTMNYISEFSSTPPVGLGGTNYANDQLPILFAYEFGSGQLYRSAFLPPFQGRLGVSYKTANGWRINPIFAFDGGYPTGVGSQTYGAVNGRYAWIPETNFGAATPLGGPQGPGNAYNASYFIDPANPGNYLSPNIAASRGYPEPALPGNAVTKAHGLLDLDLEYSPPGSKWTVGTYIGNVFNDHYGLWYPNQQYQPVATGISGPQTGTLATAYPGNPLWINGVRDNYLGTHANGPFQVPYNAGTTFQFYLQHRL